MEVPGELGITAVDAQKHEHVGQLAQGRSELIQLGLWLMAERKKVSSSPSSGFTWQCSFEYCLPCDS